MNDRLQAILNSIRPPLRPPSTRWRRRRLPTKPGQTPTSAAMLLIFFAMSIGLVLVPFIGLGWVSLALIVYSNFYLYRLNRVVYGRGAFSSVLRTVTLDSLYIVILLFALLMAVILGALSL